MAHAFFLGVDASESSDSSVDATIVVLEKEQSSADAAPSFRLDHARHLTEASPDALADTLQGFVAEQPYIGRTNLVVNRSNEVGQAVHDALDERGLDAVAATLTKGDGAVAGGPDEVGVHLGRTDAVRTLAELYRDDRFVIEDHTTEAASQLARGVLRASEILDEVDGAQDTPEAAGSTLEALDDAPPAVLSAALAAWCGTERSFDPSQHLKEDPQTGRRDPGAER